MFVGTRVPAYDLDTVSESDRCAARFVQRVFATEAAALIDHTLWQGSPGACTAMAIPAVMVA